MDLTLEDLITEEEVVVTLSHEGYVKYQPLTDYQAQRRGGKGKAAAKMKDEDFVESLLVASTHDTILCFSSIGKVYWLKVYELPQGGRLSRGKPIVNVLPLVEGEKINAILPVREYSDDKFIFFATASGTVKKTPLEAFSRPRANGIIACDLLDDDALIGVGLTEGNNDVMLFSDAGKVIRFNEEKVRSMGRTARGVRGIRLPDDQKVMSLIIVPENGSILTATANGYGKRTALDDYPTKGRGGQGVISIQVTDRNGPVVGAVAVDDNDDVILITDKGTLVRTRVEEVRVMGRNTQGVTLVKTSEGEEIVGLVRVAEIEGGDEDELVEGEVIEAEAGTEANESEQGSSDE